MGARENETSRALVQIFTSLIYIQSRSSAYCMAELSQNYEHVYEYLFEISEFYACVTL